MLKKLLVISLLAVSTASHAEQDSYSLVKNKISTFVDTVQQNVSKNNEVIGVGYIALGASSLLFMPYIAIPLGFGLMAYGANYILNHENDLMSYLFL